MEAGQALAPHSRLLESIVSITQQRSQDALIEVLARTLVSQLQPDEVLVVTLVGDSYEINWRGGRRQGELQLLAAPVLARYCQVLQEPVPSPLLDNWFEESTVILPIRYQGQISQLLCLTTPRLAMNDLRLATSLVRIYQNFLDLLSAKEHDRLTGLLNRSVLDEQISSRFLHPRSQRFSGTERRSSSVSRHWLALIGLDRFKEINDRLGYLYGDEMLILFSNLVRSSFRHHDRLFRYSGDEFVVLLPQVADEQILPIVERFRLRVASHNFPQVDQLTCSIGVVELFEEELPANLIGHADQALSWCKANGRNRCASYSELQCQGQVPQPVQPGPVDYF